MFTYSSLFAFRSHGIEVDVDIPVFVGFSFISHTVYFTVQVIDPVKNEIQ